MHRFLSALPRRADFQLVWEGELAVARGEGLEWRRELVPELELPEQREE